MNAIKKKEHKMKRILFFFLILLTSMSLLCGTKARVIDRKGDILIVDKGINDGVEIGMKGVVHKILEGVTINEGKFEVKHATMDTAHLRFIRKNPSVKIESAVQDKFYKRLIPLKKQLERLKKEIQIKLEKKDYQNAVKSVEEAIKKNPYDEELIGLNRGLNLLLSAFSAEEYCKYKSMYSTSSVLEYLRDDLYKTYPNLPPEKYLDQATTIRENSYNYFELEYGKGNVMIYVPKLKIFVDKYEVSNAQFLEKKKKNANTIYFSTLEGYPNNQPGFPAIVTFDEAVKYCNARNVRLPTEEEWEYVAGKNSGKKYSWGDAEIDNLGEYRANYESLADGFIEVAPVRSFEKYPSPFGVVNILGNVSEWVKKRICKGGGYLSEKEDLNFSDKSKDCIRVGFRCVMDAK